MRPVSRRRSLGKINQYLLKDYLNTFGMALLLIAFAMSIGNIYKVIDLMSYGLSVGLIGRFFLYNIPYALVYAIPISTLFSTLLLFGRLSADSEISAMKSSGMSMWQIAAPVLLCGICISGISLYLNLVVNPTARYETKKLISGIGVDDPIKLLEEGRFIRDFPGYMIYAGKKHKNKVRDLIVYELDRDTGNVTACVRAGKGVLSANKEAALLNINLFDVRIEIPDENDPDNAAKTHYINAREYPIQLDFKELLGSRDVHRKTTYIGFSELVYRIRNVDKFYPNLSDVEQKRIRSMQRVELHQRICLALGPFTFILIAIPLGIRSHRKESSIGMIMSLGIMFVYYLFMILSDTFDDRPELFPWLMTWIPIVGGQVGGFILLRRVD